ncbi:MAG: hypothetical protein R3Y11_04010 [Pseudomonadota bacterium]
MAPHSEASPYDNIDAQQNAQIKNYYRTKHAGTEFVLPWAVDVFFTAIAHIKEYFSVPELKTIVAAHHSVKLSMESINATALHLLIQSACDRDALHMRHRASRDVLEAKIRKLDDKDAAALMVWAASFWTSGKTSAADLDAYTVSHKK